MTLPHKIIAIHGAGMTAGIWDMLPAHLPGFSIRALTLPGHGSGGEALPTIEEIADWVRQKIEGEPCVLLGHSMGALAALVAASDPAVKGVILCATAAAMPVNADLLKTAFTAPRDAAKMVAKWGVFSGNPEADDIRINLSASTHDDALGPDLKACDDFKAGAALAAQINKPVLVISGAEDKMAKASAGKELAGLIPGADYVAIPACGHMMMVEKPVEISFQIKTFLER